MISRGRRSLDGSRVIRVSFASEGRGAADDSGGLEFRDDLGGVGVPAFPEGVQAWRRSTDAVLSSTELLMIPLRDHSSK
jgi:hypothetical protein